MNNASTSPTTRSLNSFPWLATRLRQAAEQANAIINGAETRNSRPEDIRREAFLDDLIKQIDMVIYCQISVLCYMDCSLLRLIVRVLPQQFLFDSARMVFLPESIDRAALMSIIGTNLACLLLHVVLNPPTGSELSREYVHGGFLIDFVGESAPASRLKMVVIDLCIILLQLLLLAAVSEKRRLRRSPRTSSDVRASQSDIANASSQQDTDAEEQGFRRSQEDQIDRSSIRSGGEQDSDNLELTIDESYAGHTVILSVNLTDVTLRRLRRNVN